jgi:hypothetical protein
MYASPWLASQHNLSGSSPEWMPQLDSDLLQQVWWVWYGMVWYGTCCNSMYTKTISCLRLDALHMHCRFSLWASTKTCNLPALCNNVNKAMEDIKLQPGNNLQESHYIDGSCSALQGPQRHRRGVGDQGSARLSKKAQ